MLKGPLAYQQFGYICNFKICHGFSICFNVSLTMTFWKKLSKIFEKYIYIEIFISIYYIISIIISLIEIDIYSMVKCVVEMKLLNFRGGNEKAMSFLHWVITFLRIEHAVPINLLIKLNNFFQ